MFFSIELEKKEEEEIAQCVTSQKITMKMRYVEYSITIM